ncbi:GGDEF domain-containing protein [Silvibacterium sp.]|uniref:GGDEF domain-containing protein n=1 Tax=Silvibacterium sp. TaxID=1964179 RepID=UPI0039E294E8
MSAAVPPFLRSRALLVCLVVLLVLVHLGILLCARQAAIPSSVMIALSPLVAIACVGWRCLRIAPAERTAWYWVAAACLLWSVGEFCDLTVLSEANDPTPKLSDFFFFIYALPLLLAVASTPATRTIRRTQLLNFVQVLIIVMLVQARLFRMPQHPDATVLSWIYGAELATLICIVGARWIASAAGEDRRCMRLLMTYLLLSAPMEIVTDTLAEKLGMQIGALTDILWCAPFLALGVGALYLPVETYRENRQPASSQRFRLLLQSLAPACFTVCVFLLALSIASRHLVLAIATTALSMFLSGAHSAVVQVDFLVGREELLYREEQLREMNRSLELLSSLDPLTGIANRRYLMDVFQMQMARAIRQREWIALMMIDIDHFKGINDLHGHPYGDRCLVEVAAAVKSALLRPSDFVARYGGEEFVVVLPGNDLAGAAVVADRLHAAIGNLVLRNDASPFAGRLTASIGVAAVQPFPGYDCAELISAADSRLYLAKRGGRNRISLVECGAEYGVERGTGIGA